MTRQTTLIVDTLELWGERFPFYLEHQQIELGAAGPADFYYMPVSPLRKNDPNRKLSNFRSCVEHFRCVGERAGNGNDWDVQRDHVLASSYELVRTDKAVQRIYRDAFSRPRSFTPENLKLSDDVRVRIKSAVASHDKEAIRQEMEKALQAVQLSREDEVASTFAMDNWLNNGVERLRRDGRDGLLAWLGDVENWYKKFRRKSDPRVQTFLRVFAYEAKVSFYHKYCNFWISLLPWLVERFDLNLTSQRFMGIWHNQNQRVEIDHFRRPGDVVAAASQATLRLDGANDDRRVGGRLVDQGTVEVVPDVFCGQVLALHPLTWILLDRPELCDLVGSYLASPKFDAGLKSGHVDDFREYWAMVEAIVTAAYLYQVAHEGNESRRKQRPLGGTDNSAAIASSAPGPLTEDAQLRDFVDAANKACPCGGKYEYADSEIPGAAGETIVIPVICGSCGLPSELQRTLRDMEEFFELEHKPARRRRPPR